MSETLYKIQIDSDRVKIFNAIIEALAAIVSELRLKLTKKGLYFCGMDGSHICLIQGLLALEDFAEYNTLQKTELTKLEKQELEEIRRLEKVYRCGQVLNDSIGEKVQDQLFTMEHKIENSLLQIDLGLNIEDMVKILKRNTKDTLTIKNGDQGQVDFEFKPESAKKVRTFSMSLIDIDSEEINMESLEGMSYDNSFSINMEAIDEVIKDASVYSEVLEVKIGKHLVFSTEGSRGKYKNEIEKDELVDSNFECESEGSFAIQFLKSIWKIGLAYGTSSSTAYKHANVKIWTKSEAPLKMEFKLMENSKIQYFLSPRVEEDIPDPYEEKAPVKVESPKIEVPAEGPQIQVPPMPVISLNQIAMAFTPNFEGLKAEILGKIAAITNAKSGIEGLKNRLIECNESEYSQIKSDYNNAKLVIAEEQEINEMKSFLKL